MPRYHFVVHAPDHRHDDRYGTRLPDHDAARDYAIRIARELKEDGYTPGTVVIVQDDGRNTIHAVPL
jgi:hypothetical protein